MKKEERFIYFTAVDISVDNGAGINEREFVRELMNGYRDKVICILPEPACPQNYYNKEIEYVPNHKGHRLLNWFEFIASSYLRILRIRKKFSIRAVVLRLDIMPIAEFLICFLRTPVILKTLAGGTFKARRLVQIVKDIGAPLRHKIINNALAADAVGFTSKRWLVETFGFEPDHIAVIPNAANIDFFTPGSRSEGRLKMGIDESKFVIGYVGALRKISCIDKLLYAFQNVGHDDVYLVLVGAGPERSTLEELAQRLGIAEKVMFFGSVPYHEVPILIRSFNVAVDLTASPIRIHDKIVNASYSQKIPQYLACGIPVIAWDLEDTRFLEREKIGRIVQEENSNALTAALSDMIDLNQSQKDEFRKRTRQYAEEQLSFSSLVKQRVQFWEDMT